MDAELSQKLSELEDKLDDARASLRKIERYFQITFWVTVVFVVVPIVGLLYAIPKVMNSYVSSLSADDMQLVRELY